ncbi:MAG: NADH-quinone oxidoreductase subunit D [bacterium]|nr:NADH-quinone oxidoreductase subunit D [bacterium]
MTSINFGPQHPSTHGVLNLKTVIEGDTVLSVEPNLGFLHRGVEKAAEERRYIQFLPMIEKTDYVAAFSWDNLYMTILEDGLKIQVPPRAQFIRTILLEMQRIMSHLVWLAAFGQDLGQPTVFLWAFREREPYVELFEELSGGRLHYYYGRIGGVKRDFLPDTADKLLHYLKGFEERLREIEGMTVDNIIFQKRTKDVGTLTKEKAVELGATGPMLRSCGINHDLRKVEPYLVYKEAEFDVPVAEEGDCWARTKVRVEEMRQSVKIIRQLLAKMPEGEIVSGPFLEDRTGNQMLKAYTMRLPAGEYFARQELPRGEGAIYLISDGGMKPYRFRMRSPAFCNLSLVTHLVRNVKIADMIAILGSLDLVYGEIDR